MAAGLEFSAGGHVVMWRAVDHEVMSVGRNPACDLCVPDPEIASVQGLLRRLDGVLTFENRSEGGTWIGDEVIKTTHRLADGDRIRLGKLVATVRLRRATGDVTRTLPVERNVGGTFEVGVDGAPKRWPVDDRGVSIGSDPHNDIVLEDAFVSAFHARLSVREGRCMVRDLGSRNGILLGDHKVLEAQVPAGGVLTVGRARLSVRMGTARVGADGTQLIGGSTLMAQARERILRVAGHDAPVLITGETGTGKEIAARLLVADSPRAHAPMLALNCGTLSRELVASELFGHEKGAFTGATLRKVGAFEACNGGTLFLDEIGELPLDLQPQLLRVVEYGEVRRVGGQDTVRVDVRLLAATHRDLRELVGAGRFREDLFHRLHVLSVELPALRQRREDIPELVEHFLNQFAPAGVHLTVAPAAMAKLCDHAWPGNVRELRNVLQRAVLMRTSTTLGPDDLSLLTPVLAEEAEVQVAVSGRTLAEIERVAIVRELARHQGRKAEAALALGISRSTMHRKIEEYGITVPKLER